MKKIIIISMICILVSGCGCTLTEKKADKDTKNAETKEEKTKTAKVSNGALNTINEQGFNIDLQNSNGIGIISIKKVSTKANQSYKIKIEVYDKTEQVTSLEPYIPASNNDIIQIETNLKYEEITKIKYEVNETKTIVRGH